jgi:hypothetical protein
LGFSKRNLTAVTLKEVISLCEQNIKGITNQQWICKIGTFDDFISDDGEAFCDCFLKKKCEIQKVIQYEN